MKLISHSSKETQKIGQLLASEIKNSKLICLEGNLGGGKTTFVQGLALGLNIKEQIKSPTFVFIKKYKINKKSNLKWLYHIDAYRIKNPLEFLDMGLEEILEQKNALCVIEWADKIKSVLPKNKLTISFKYLGKNKREIKFC